QIFYPFSLKTWQKCFTKKLSTTPLSPGPSFGQGTLPFRQKRPKSCMKLTFNTGGIESSASLSSQVFFAVSPRSRKFCRTRGRPCKGGGAYGRPLGARSHCGAHVAHAILDQQMAGVLT